MSITLRLTIIVSCIALCLAALSWKAFSRLTGSDAAASDSNKDFLGDYLYARGDYRTAPNWRQMEEVIRRDQSEKPAYHKMEFESLEMQGATAVVEVAFVSPSGHAIPFLYKMAPDHRGSWRIVMAQRLWFTPGSKLRRGIGV